MGENKVLIVSAFYLDFDMIAFPLCPLLRVDVLLSKEDERERLT